VQPLLAFLIAFIMTNASAAEDARVWATAVSKHQSSGRAIVFRYVRVFPTGFIKDEYPVRIILQWKYQSETGMPQTAERERMERLEDLLQPSVEASGLSTLAIVSTGENLREWIYYTKSEPQFFAALNRALGQEARFPIEIHAAPDAVWHTYETFRIGVRE
jgi:hypothetical protein